MRIWIVNHYAVPPEWGGITRHYELAQEWSKKEGADITLWLSSFHHNQRRFIHKRERDQVRSSSDFRLNWLWSFPHRRNDIRRIFNMMSFAFLFFWCGLIQRRPNWIFASTPHLLTPLAGWMLSRLKRCGFTLEVRDLWPDTLIRMNGLRHPVMIHLLRRLESFLYQKADKIIVLTEYQRCFLLRKGVETERITLIPNGILVDTWKPDSSRIPEYRSKMGVGPNQFVALYAGAHGEANALEYVVQAGRYLPEDCAVVLIGDGPEKDKLRRMKEEEGLHHVHFLDSVSKDEIYNYIHAADCGIISLQDNDIFRGARPNKLFDYMYAGKPIITTVSGEIREIVEKNKVGIFSGAEDPNGLAQAILRIKRYSPEELEEVAEQGRRYIDQSADRSKLARVLYSELDWNYSPRVKEMEQVKR